MLLGTLNDREQSSCQIWFYHHQWKVEHNIYYLYGDQEIRQRYYMNKFGWVWISEYIIYVISLKDLRKSSIDDINVIIWHICSEIDNNVALVKQFVIEYVLFYVSIWFKTLSIYSAFTDGGSFKLSLLEFSNHLNFKIEQLKIEPKRAP